MNLMERIIEDKRVAVDPDLSGHYLKFNTYKVQRKVRGLHVAELAEKMKSGLFHVGRIIFARIMINGKPVDIIMDGQHVCYAVIDSGVTVACNLLRFAVKSKSELSELFRQCEQLPRSIEDMVKAEADALDIPWPQWIASLTVKAATVDRYGSLRINPPGSPGKVTATRRSLSNITKDQRVRLRSKMEALGYWWHMMAIVRAYEYVQPAGYVASDRVKAALEYHGIRFAESDPDGTLWFERDGQRCKVFTVACLKAVEKRR